MASDPHPVRHSPGLCSHHDSHVKVIHYRFLFCVCVCVHVHVCVRILNLKRNYVTVICLYAKAYQYVLNTVAEISRDENCIQILKVKKV